MLQANLWRRRRRSDASLFNGIVVNLTWQLSLLLAEYGKIIQGSWVMLQESFHLWWCFINAASARNNYKYNNKMISSKQNFQSYRELSWRFRDLEIIVFLPIHIDLVWSSRIIAGNIQGAVIFHTMGFDSGLICY
jgi:hypothetical protein